MLLDSALIGNLDLIPSGSIPDRLKRIPPIYGFCFPLGDFKFTRKFLTPTDLLLPSADLVPAVCSMVYNNNIREDRYIDKLEVTV